VQLTISEQPDDLGRAGRPLAVSLVQSVPNRDVRGRRMGRAEALSLPPSPQDVVEFESIIAYAPRESHLVVVTYHTGARPSVTTVQQFADTTRQTVVTLLGPVPVGSEFRNRLVVCRPGRPVVEQDKISLDAEDENLRTVTTGNVLNVFRNDELAWAVVNCHDYSHVDVVLALQELELDLVVVVSDNTASRLFEEYALADIHRLFCFVVVANAGDFGGSCIFAPFRRLGKEEHAQIGAAGRLFAATGPAKVTATLDLDVPELRKMRREFRQNGLRAEYLRPGYVGDVLPIAPSEHVVAPKAYAT